jgi:endoglucanase
MNEKFSNSRVKGFLKAKGRSIVNEAGEEIILSGWGLGNWLLQEGYMWTAGGSRFDRPQRIEAVVRELTGSKYAEEFWKKFRQEYITREDIRLMAEQGYNSVRIPINWRILMEDEPGITWKEEGFKLIDNCLDWCEEYNIYAFLDLHGAPGGQTGANIDDCVDDMPRLFMDEDSWNKGISLWKELAERYKDRWIVGGYDLLNEPLRTAYGPDNNVDYLLPKLVEFYEEATAAIRTVDTKHMLSIEGHHWATDTSVFFKKYDDNMVIHFHRYACLPEIASLNEFLEVSERLDAPLWLGETGENIVEWYTALYPLSAEVNIGYNLWPWKKMNCTNSPYSIELPEGWEKLMAYIQGGVHPGYEEAQKILDSYLENMKTENCRYNRAVTSAVFRTPGSTVRATDFDEIPGKGKAYSGTRTEGNMYKYRANTGMGIIEEIPVEKKEKRFFFDCQWDRFLLELKNEEFATYSINNTVDGSSVSFVYSCAEPVSVTVMQDGVELCTLELQSMGGKETTEAISLSAASESKVKIVVNKGTLWLEKICFS